MDRRVIIPTLLDPASLTPPGPEQRRVELCGETMGTSWSAKFYCPPSVVPETVETSLYRVFKGMADTFSNWDERSFVSCFNRSAKGTIHNIDTHLSRVLSQAIELVELTGGVFNPCLGEFASTLIYEEACQPAASLFAGIDGSVLRTAFDVQNSTITQPGNLQLDLSAVAKGYAVDMMAKGLTTMGVSSFLVEIGGEFVGRGVKPDCSPWWVELPAGLAETYLAALCDLALATSGTSERSYKIGEEKLSHIAGAQGGLKSVTVIADTCAFADGWATALIAAGREEAYALAEDNGLAVLFIDTNHSLIATSSLTAMLQ